MIKRRNFLKSIATAAIGPLSVDLNVLKAADVPKIVKEVQSPDLRQMNCYIGHKAGTTVTSGSHNMAIGYRALA